MTPRATLTVIGLSAFIIALGTFIFASSGWGALALYIAVLVLIVIAAG